MFPSTRRNGCADTRNSVTNESSVSPWGPVQPCQDNGAVTPGMNTGQGNPQGLPGGGQYFGQETGTCQLQPGYAQHF